MVASILGVLAGVTVTTVPSESVRTTVAYDDGPRLLTLRCDEATRGACVFVVDDGRVRRRVLVRPRTQVRLTGVSPGARFCAVGRNPGSACDWTPVRGATS